MSDPLTPRAQDLLRQFEGMLHKEAVAFVEGQSAAVLELGEEAVKAILSAEVYDRLPLPKIPPEGTLSMAAVVAYEDLLAQRDRVFQLVAAAEKRNKELVAQMRGAAAGVAARIAGGVLSAALVLGKMALGG